MDALHVVTRASRKRAEAEATYRRSIVDAVKMNYSFRMIAHAAGISPARAHQIWREAQNGASSP
jgi:hypothetical protein